MSIQSITNDNLASYALGIKLRDMAIEANSSSRYEPKPIQTSVTKEMIQDYIDEQNKPIIKDGRLYKYHPATVQIELKKIDAADKQPVLDDIDIAENLNLQKVNGDNYVKLEHIKQNLLDAIQTNLHKREAPLGNPKHEPIRSKKKNRLSKIQKPEYIAEQQLIKEYNERMQKILDDNTNIQLQIDNADAKMKTILNDQRILQQRIETNKANSDINQKLEMDVKKENEKLIKKQEENIMALNSGKLSLDRQPAETEQDYLNRLNKIGRDPDESLEAQVVYKNTEDFKNMLRQVINSESIIEDVLKIYNNDDRFLILKNKKLIIDKLIKRFGVNNKRVNAEDIREAIEHIGKQLQDQPSQPSITNIYNAEPKEPKEPDETRPIKKPVGRPRIHPIKPIVKKSTKETAKSKTQPEMMPELWSQEEVANYQGQPKTDREAETTEPYGALEIKSGHGFKSGFIHKEIPKYINFGNVILLLKKLYYKNILAVKDHNMINIKGFTNLHVSEILVDIIMKLCYNKTPNKVLINSLSTTEKHIFNTLIHIANLHKDIDTPTSDKTIDHLKNRMQLIEGEIQSGNNNPELLHELQTILHKLVHFNIITSYQALKHIKQYKTALLNV